MEYNPFSLQRKNIIVTGASSGIGRQSAIDCSRMGARVALIGRNIERLKETLSQMYGEGHEIFILDLTDGILLQNKVSEIVERMGVLDGILHCAGISSVLPLKLAKRADMERFMNTNVYSAIELTRECLKKKNFSPEGGAVIFLSSVMGIVGEKAKFLYSMTKGALISGCKSLALEYAQRKIRINCISPGAIETPLNASLPYMADKEMRSELEAKHPLGLGQTSDISHCAIYLLSNASRWITGQNIIVDGGYTAI